MNFTNLLPSLQTDEIFRRISNSSRTMLMTLTFGSSCPSPNHQTLLKPSKTPNVNTLATPPEEMRDAPDQLRDLHAAVLPPAEQVRKKPRTTRSFKWGSCTKCGLARSPHIFNSGMFRGSLRLVCNGFWKFSQQGGRRCWTHAAFDFDTYKYSECPEYLRRHFESLEAGFLRGRVR